MNVLLISQCSDKALKETRRIIDQFAERKGTRTWQTSITQQGLLALRKLLRKTARRNTSVICHWIKKANYSEVLWIVGNTNKFNEQGNVPTNMTTNNILRTENENSWHTLENITLLASIAGLFHDIGKANNLFQSKLKKNQKIAEPYRHEWVSLRLFEAFVNAREDKDWLTELSQITPDIEKEVLTRLQPIKTANNSPLKALKPIAKIVGWLIVSHHRLPKNPGKLSPDDEINLWADYSLNNTWNSTSKNNITISKQDIENNWTFKHNTPFASNTWCKKANKIATRALKHSNLFTIKNWFDDHFSNHLARLSLMLADHKYSADDATKKYQDKDYAAYANTDKNGALKQKLDEHNIGVCKNAASFARSLPRIKNELPSITGIKPLKKPTKHKDFQWQNKAYELAYSLKEKTQYYGFFGINMASTGCGKTFANARIMYGLADEKLGCRFSVALGLRTLTLQTGDAFREHLHLNDDDLAVMIGSQSVKQLHELRQQESEKNFTGSESSEELYDESFYFKYDGAITDGVLSQWLQHRNKELTLISAPVLVSTIDHLMPATEGERGGRQIAPMLRLLTSDLILDEPDDFGIEDLPALARLVNWAGTLGSRVLLSSATLPPALINVLFEAYQSGRQHYNNACLDAQTNQQICCAWFDEKNKPQSGLYENIDSFSAAHQTVVNKRIKHLATNKPLRYAQMVTVQPEDIKAKTVLHCLASTFHNYMHQLHDQHHETSPAKQHISIGLIRMANINTMVALSQSLLAIEPKENYCIHFCIYHSQHPLIIRSNMEKILDSALKRDEKNPCWNVPSIANAIKDKPQQNHIFLVLATAVAEVGRDHDYDWAIAEPSSMRSLIQLAGRIQRHRQQEPNTPNFLILNKNYKTLINKSIAYSRPGFESNDFQLDNKDLNQSLIPIQYEHINAIPRITQNAELHPTKNLVDLEHARLQSICSGNPHNKKDYYSELWWKYNITWSAQMQQETRFRASQADEQFCYYLEDEYEKPRWKLIDREGTLLGTAKIKDIPFKLTNNAHAWINNDFSELLTQLAEQLEKPLTLASLQFGGITLRKDNDPDSTDTWLYNPLLGIHQIIR